MKAILTRRSGVAVTVDVYRDYPDMPTEVLENKILEALNSFEGVDDSFTSIKILNRDAKAPKSQMKK